MTKAEQRALLEQDMNAFITGGGKITKCKPEHKPRFKKSKEEADDTEMVEIEVSALPIALVAKFFPEEL